MADTVIRLKVESTEYEGKIKRAVQGMQQLEKHVRDMGTGFEVAEKADLEFVRALGQMETKATSNTGKLAELKSAFVELSVQYKNLSDAEKKGEFGKALNQSLGQLKGRIDDLGGQIKEANTDINGMGGVLDAVAGKIGIPVELFTKMGVAVAAAGAAIKVATDAFKQNEELMDEWGRITESATSIYDGFLNALNTGNFGTFFSNMDRIIQSARDAYDALDELGTFQAFNQINELKARAGMDSAIAAYREGTGSREAVQTAGANMKAQLEQRMQLQQEAYEKKIAELAAARGVDAAMLTEAMSGSYGDYNTLKNLGLTGTKVTQKSAVNVASDQVYTWEETTAVAANEMERLGEMLRGFTDDELKVLQALGADAARTEVEIAGVEKQLARILKKTDEGKASGGAGVDLTVEQEALKKITELTNEALTADDARKEAIRVEIAGLQNQVAEYKKIKDYVLGIKKEEEKPSMSGPYLSAFEKLQQSIRIKLGDQNFAIDNASLTNLLTVAIQNGIDSLNPDFENLQYKMAEGLDIPDSAWQELTDKINAQLAELGIDPIVLDVTTGGVSKVKAEAEGTAGAWQDAVSAVSQLGGAIQQIEDPTAKVAGIIAQAIATIALTFASSLKGTVTPWDWIAAAISGTATMIGTIASIKSVTQGFADGGMVGGNSYSGDNIVARLNSGEGVLTANGVRNAQAMASNANPMGNIHFTAKITGHDILLVGSNYALEIGKAGAYLPIIAG